MKKRINCYPNGSQKNGKAVVFYEEDSIIDIKKKCLDKFNSTSNFVKFFTTKGGEIEKTEELFHDDIIFVSFKPEEFKSPISKLLLFGNFNENEEISLTSLSEDIMCIIFSFFDYNEINHVLCLVNKEWNRVLQKDIFWKYLTFISYEERRKQQKNEEEKINRIIKKMKKMENEIQWKKFYFSYVQWGLNLRWDSVDHGKSISISDHGMTMEMSNQSSMFESIRTNFSIEIPPISDISKSPLPLENEIKNDVFEWEVKIDKCALNHEWSIVFGLEREYFSFQKATYSNVIGYGVNSGFGVGLKNGLIFS
jgi:hypothetical protein